jgi:serine/threonine protein kinase
VATCGGEEELVSDTETSHDDQIGDSPIDESASSHHPNSGSLAKDAAAATGGATTGGFDTLLGKLVVENGLVLSEELQQCEASRKDVDDSGALSLADILVSKDFVTIHQIKRLQKEFEAKKSSQRIPGYRILKKLGAGAMATVFLARQQSLDRDVAIKVLPKKFSENPQFIERFYKEGRAAAQLNHPNIVQAYDVGKTGEHHYFVMEFVDGVTVYDRIVEEKRMKEVDAIDVVMQVSEALHHAHDRGFIHRDIKPKNIMISERGAVKLADLGLARALDDEETAKAEAGRAYGTPYYIAPEQIRGEMKITQTADIYGLGATCYHMVTGRVPYTGKNPSEVMHKHLKAELEPPDHINPTLTPGFAQVIEMMLAKDPADRYHSATDLMEDLALVRDGKPPHFARPKLDLSSISISLKGAQTSPDEVVRREPESTGNASTWITLLISSAVINLILLIVLIANLS